MPRNRKSRIEVIAYVRRNGIGAGMTFYSTQVVGAKGHRAAVNGHFNEWGGHVHKPWALQDAEMWHLITGFRIVEVDLTKTEATHAKNDGR